MMFYFYISSAFFIHDVLLYDAIALHQNHVFLCLHINNCYECFKEIIISSVQAAQEIHFSRKDVRTKTTEVETGLCGGLFAFD